MANETQVPFARMHRPPPGPWDLYGRTEFQMEKTLNTSLTMLPYSQCPNQPIHHQIKVCSICGKGADLKKPS
jgi:hypothetical protein